MQVMIGNASSHRLESERWGRVECPEKKMNERQGWREEVQNFRVHESMGNLRARGNTEGSTSGNEEVTLGCARRPHGEMRSLSSMQG